MALQKQAHEVESAVRRVCGATVDSWVKMNRGRAISQGWEVLVVDSLGWREQVYGGHMGGAGGNMEDGRSRTVGDSRRYRGGHERRRSRSVGGQPQEDRRRHEGCKRGLGMVGRNRPVGNSQWEGKEKT